MPSFQTLDPRLQTQDLYLWSCTGLHQLALIGFELALIGFVFTRCPIAFIFIIHFCKDTYVHLTFLEIGFVLHKKVDL